MIHRPCWDHMYRGVRMYHGRENGRGSYDIRISLRSFVRSCPEPCFIRELHSFVSKFIYESSYLNTYHII